MILLYPITYAITITNTSIVLQRCLSKTQLPSFLAASEKLRQKKVVRSIKGNKKGYQSFDLSQKKKANEKFADSLMRTNWSSKDRTWSAVLDALLRVIK